MMSSALMPSFFQTDSLFFQDYVLELQDVQACKLFELREFEVAAGAATDGSLVDFDLEAAADLDHAASELSAQQCAQSHAVRVANVGGNLVNAYVAGPK